MARDIAILEPNPIDWGWWVSYLLEQLEGEAQRRGKYVEFTGILELINWQNLQNSYHRRKRTAYYGILPLRIQILLKLGTHVASYGVFHLE